MKIIVCIKQVPDTSDIKWTENNTMQREGVESIINPCDIYAIEEAIKLKKKYNNVEITAITMGPPQAEEMLKQTIALGCDNGVLLSDKKFAGADTYATSRTIASAISKHLKGFDLIVCGQFAIDGDTAQTGPGIAACLDLPQITYVKEIKDIQDGKLTAVRELDEGLEVVTSELPALVCVIKGEYEPTRPKINDVIRAQETPITTYGLVNIPLVESEVGLKGSPTYVSKAFRMITEHHCQMAQSVEEVAQKIKEYK